ncbi:amidohydrolase family protein [Streptomyces laculatispora]|uniref:Amidohydrolase family protein n=1 Tax=Streptomyces laculatispora TaxID=887464 RepID=A0ABY9HYQ9_9ACTN|nr:amidohydrolase family protein [Streptomyces laculatispora]WLQ39700.1 amidohydrolase family protein [Streptomyces laculatispora]
MLCIRGVVLPEREERAFWIDGEVLRAGMPPGGFAGRHAETVVDGGWLLPGLVDVHTHPGAEGLDIPFDEELLRRHLEQHRDAGVLAVRTPGTAARMPSWVDKDPELPRVTSAGRWLATPGRFFPGFGRDVSEEDLVRAAVEEAAASSGWCKVIGDWRADEPALPLALLTGVVSAVHAVGGKVAVHCQTAEGSRNAVLAGADSLEHGMHLDPALLDRMAAQGTAFVPTLSAFGRGVDAMRAREPSVRRDLWLAGWETMFAHVRAAAESGVTVLAGTDSFPCGTVAGEASWLARAGLSAEAALGAASWTARAWLGLPGLVDGAPADLVAYATDPTTDPAVLDHPSRIVLRGRVVR